MEERRKERGRGRKRSRKRGHQRSSSKVKGGSADALRLEPIHLHRLRVIRENTCTALLCTELCLHACLPECSNIWQRSKCIKKKEHLHSIKQPSKQTALMKVVTVPKYKGALSTTYFPLIKGILSTGSVFFWAHWGKLQQLKRLFTCVSICLTNNT